MLICSQTVYLRPPNDEQVKLLKYISKEGLIRLGFFLVLLVSAWLFDTFHKADPTQQEKHADAGHENDAASAAHFFCTFQGTMNLKAPVQKTLLKKSFQEKLNQQVIAQLKARMIYLLKAEIQDLPQAFLALRNIHHLRYCHSGTPDDIPLS